MGKIVCYLVLDFDGVLIPGEELMDNYIWDICKEASNRYRESLEASERDLFLMKQRLEDERSNPKYIERVQKELNDIRQKRLMHFRKKDQVLEETSLEFVNKIPYQEIYVRDNFFPGILELIHKINDMGIYVELIVNTHFNADLEVKTKRELLRKEFPPHKFIPVPFHLEKQYSSDVITRKRVRTNKTAKLIKALPYVNPLANEDVFTYFVDNTKSILEEAEKFGLITYFVEKNDDKYIIDNPTLNPIPFQVILQAANDTLEKQNGDKVKKLII